MPIDVDEDVEEVYDISRGKKEKTEELTGKISSLLGDGGLDNRERKMLVNSTKKMLSEGKLNEKEASEVLESSTKNLDHEFNEIQSDNAELLQTFTETHPNLIKEKSGEIAEKLSFSTNNKKVIENNTNLAKKMKENNTFEEEHFSKLVQKAANNIIGEENDSIIESVSRGKEGSSHFLNEMIDGRHVKGKHFSKGQLKQLAETTKEEEPDSIIGDISAEEGEASEALKLHRNLKNEGVNA